MEEIENKLNALMNSQGAENIRTSAGTAYKSTIMAVKITDRDKFLDYVVREIDTNGECGMLMASPKKDEVQQYIDVHQSAPPGVGVDYIVRVNVRRS